MVADGGCFAPDGAPRFVELAGLLAFQGEAVNEVGLLQSFRGVLVLGQFQSQVRRAHDILSLKGHGISGPSLLDAEIEHDVAVR